MRRREMLLSTGAAVVGLSTFPIGWTAAADNRKQKLLYFTRNCLHEHEPVRPRNGELSLSEKLLIEWGKTAGFDVDCSKDGRWKGRTDRVTVPFLCRQPLKKFDHAGSHRPE